MKHLKHISDNSGNDEAKKSEILKEINDLLKDCDLRDLYQIYGMTRHFAGMSKRINQWEGGFKKFQKEILLPSWNEKENTKLWTDLSRDERKKLILNYLPGFDKGESSRILDLVAGNNAQYANRNLQDFIYDSDDWGFEF